MISNSFSYRVWSISGSILHGTYSVLKPFLVIFTNTVLLVGLPFVASFLWATQDHSFVSNTLRLYKPVDISWAHGLSILVALVLSTVYVIAGKLIKKSEVAVKRGVPLIGWRLLMTAIRFTRKMIFQICASAGMLYLMISWIESKYYIPLIKDLQAAPADQVYGVHKFIMAFAFFYAIGFHLIYQMICTSNEIETKEIWSGRDLIVRNWIDNVKMFWSRYIKNLFCYWY